MGREFQEYFECSQIYACEICRAHLSSHSQLISKAFSGRDGRAFLFKTVINGKLGDPEEQTLLSGLYIIRDLYCKSCDLLIGWKYDKAYTNNQKYKEGKFILERYHIVKIEWDK